MAQTSQDGRGVISGRLRELVETLQAAPAIERFRAADVRFRTDAQLVRLQASVQSSHERLQAAQREKRHDPRLFQEMRDAQALLQSHPLVVEYVAARQAAQELLRRVNHEMASILGVDIGASAGRAGGCC